MEKGYTKVENFKLLLHPASMASTITTAIETTSSPYFEVPTLPAGLTIEQVYSDYIRYLMEHTKAYFEATSVTGDKIWENLFEDVSRFFFGSRIQRNLFDEVLGNLHSCASRWLEYVTARSFAQRTNWSSLNFNLYNCLLSFCQ